MLSKIKNIIRNEWIRTIALLVVMAPIVMVLQWTMAKSYIKSDAALYAEVTLDTANTVFLDDDVVDESVERVISSIDKLNVDRTIPFYLYINSGGGSIDSGIKLVDFLKLRRNSNVTCIAETAMSMAFVIMQACPTRLVMSYSTLMQHEPTFNIPFPFQLSNMEKFFEHQKKSFELLYKMQAARIGISVDDYLERVKDDWWIAGSNNIKEGTADYMTVITCSAALSEAWESKDVMMFGVIPATIEVSKCPIFQKARMPATR